MAYFVTGATGFIGRFLVANLLKRGEPIYVLVRKSSAKKLAELRDDYWGATDKQVIAVVGDLGKQNLGVSDGRPEKAARQGEALLPSRRDLRPHGERRGAADRERRRHAQRRRVRRGDQGGLLPPCELDRRRGPLRRRLPRGHVRGGRGPRSSVFQHQARFRGRRAHGMQAAVPDLPARLRRRRTRRRATSTRSTGRTISSSSSRRLRRRCRRGCR